MVQEAMQGQEEHRAAQLIAASAEKGIVIVDASGQIIWTDARLRKRLDGELNRLTLPLNRAETQATRPMIEGFIATVELEVGGEPQQVCVIQQAARESAHEAGLQRIVDSVEEVLAEPSWLTRTLMEKLRARLQKAPSARPADLKRLTAREREILGLVCEGCTDAEMADILKLSHNTVRNHLASLFRKIGVNRRSAAVIWARERAITKHDMLDSSALRDRMPRFDGDDA